VDAAQDTELDPAVQHAAERLRHADSVHRPCDSVGDLIGDDLEAAYAVQRLVTELQVIGGAHPWGRKVLDLRDTHDGPLVAAGTLVDTMVVRDDAQVTGRDLVQPRVAVRVSVRRARDVAAGAEPDEVEAAVGAVGAALEIADLRVSAEQATAADVVADNVGAGLVVLGPERSPRESPGPWRARVVLDDDQAPAPVVEVTWDDTIGRLAGLADVAAELGRPLRAGEIVLLDSFGTAVPLAGDGRYAAEVDGRVVASIRFGASRPARPEEMS
jgi:2-keto-4-pentenoate hydratase